MRLCAYYGPDCPACLYPEDECTCGEDCGPFDDEETDDDDTC